MPTTRYIAIVDDDESVREATISLFRSMGYRASAFGSAEAFLDSGAIEQASCLVLDVQMPGMGGLRLQSYLAATGRHIPIVFMTAFPDEQICDQALKQGAFRFLTKPFTEQDLLSGVGSALAHEDV